MLTNNGNALTALTQPPSNDFKGGSSEKTGCTTHRKSNGEARRLSRNMCLEYRNGYVVQPEPTDLSIGRVGRDIDGAVRWLDQFGTREWAVSAVQYRLASKPVPSPAPEIEEDDADWLAGTAADVLNTLICNIDDAKFDMADPDDLDDLECQIAPALDIPDTADMAAALLLDLEDGCVTLDDVRQRVDEMLAVLLQMEEEEMDHRKEKNASRWMKQGRNGSDCHEQVVSVAPKRSRNPGPVHEGLRLGALRRCALRRNPDSDWPNHREKSLMPGMLPDSTTGLPAVSHAERQSLGARYYPDFARL